MLAEDLKDCEVTVFNMREKKCNPRLACGACQGKDTQMCVQKDDIRGLLPAIDQCDGILLATPIYNQQICSQAKLFKFDAPLLSNTSKPGKKGAIKGAEGGTHLRNVILSLTKPTDKAAAQMEELGFSIFDISQRHDAQAAARSRLLMEAMTLVHPYFLWNGVSSEDYGIMVSEYPAISRPKERVSQITIPGRSGVLMIPESDLPVYEPVLKTVTCWSRPDADIDLICARLKGSGSVVFGNEPNRSCDARIINQMTMFRATILAGRQAG